MTPGVYWIYQLSRDRVVYVGSSRHVERRLREHAAILGRGKAALGNRKCVGVVHSDEARRNMSMAHRGCVLSQQHRDRISAGLRRSYASGLRAPAGLDIKEA